MFYDYNKILSYNCLLNILIGERGVGKTYGCIKFCVNDFLKNQNEFVYIRRFKSELQKATPTFFDALNSNNEFTMNLYSKSNKFYCDDTICGHAIQLSTSQSLKSVNFSKVKNIIFDEFIIEEGQRLSYLKNEVFIFLNLIETISRLRDVRIFLLANSANNINPYFLYFNLSLPYNNDIKLFKDNTILLQYMKNEEYRNTKKATRFGKLISNTDYEDYAVNNIFINDNFDFIEKKSGGSKFIFSFIYKNETFGVWKDENISKIFISSDFIKNSPFTFATTLQDHTYNTMFLHTAKKYNCWKNLITNYEIGNVRFENMKIKNIFLELIKCILYK